MLAAPKSSSFAQGLPVALQVSYEGADLQRPEQRPTVDEIIESEDGERRLAGLLLRSFADRVTARRSGSRATVTFHFDHQRRSRPLNAASPTSPSSHRASSPREA